MIRIDQLLTQNKLCKSRAQAQTFITENKVTIFLKGQWQTVSKASLKVDQDIEIKLLLDDADRFVSRGALKLAGALSHTQLNITGFTVLDVGQSTGGFTDCALQAGAKQVVGIEVGHDQLDPSLRDNPQVVCLEGINARHLDKKDLAEHFPEHGFDLVIMDVSFISQTKILDKLPPLLKPGGHLITLIKPQFEVGKQAIGKGGIVKDQKAVEQLEATMKNLIQSLGFKIHCYIKSQIKGGDGNQEYLVWASLAAQ